MTETEEKLEELRQQRSELEQTRQEQKEKLDLLEEELTAARESLERAEQEREAAQKQQESWEQELQALQEEQKACEEQDAALKQELAGLFALAFGKKKEVKGRIEETAARLAECKTKLEAVRGRDPGPETKAAAEQAEACKAQVLRLEEAQETGREERREQDAELVRQESELAELEETLEAERRAAEATEADPLAVGTVTMAYDFSADHPEWPAIENEGLRQRRNHAVSKLLALYPEGKIFALSALNDELRVTLTELSRALGYDSLDGLYADYGFERISGSQVKKLRAEVAYQPGSEPDVIRNRLNSVLRRLEEYYPDHVIGQGIERDHKALSGALSGVYQWLGYADRKCFAEAYGFEYHNENQGGRPVVDYTPVLEELTEKYAHAEKKPATVAALMEENPEYRSRLKTLSNRARELLGATLSVKLKEAGILAGK